MVIEPMAHLRKPLNLQFYECFKLGVCGLIPSMHSNPQRLTVGDALSIPQRGYGRATATDSLFNSPVCV